MKEPKAKTIHFCAKSIRFNPVAKIAMLWWQKSNVHLTLHFIKGPQWAPLSLTLLLIVCFSEVAQLLNRFAVALAKAAQLLAIQVTQLLHRDFA